MLTVRGLSQQFYLSENPDLFSNLSFEVAKGERVAILGRNGQGKSTLIKILGGVLAPTSGRVTWDMTASWPIGFAGAFQGSLTGMDNILFVSRIYRKLEPWVSIRWDAIHKCVFTEWKAFANSAEFRAALMRALDAIKDHRAVVYLSDTRKVKVVVHKDQDWQTRSGFHCWRRAA